MQDKIPKKFLNNQNSSYVRGLEFLKHREFGQAINSFQKAIEQTADFAFAYHYLGESFFALSEFEKSERAFQRAFDLNSYFTPTLLFLGAIAGKKGDCVKKEEYYQKALREKEKSTSTKELKQIAQALVKIGDGDHPAVFDFYLKALQLNPQDFEIFLEIAEIYPPNLSIYTEFGEFLAETGKTEQAIFFLYLAAYSGSCDKENWTRLANVLDKSGDYESAEICRQRA